MMKGKLEKIVLGRSQPPLMLLLEMYGWKHEDALLAAAILQIVVLLLLAAAIILFAEWRFVQWDKLGCAAYCRCVERIGNMTYTI